MVFDIWCTEPYMTPEFAYSGGPCPRQLSKSWTCVVGWQFLLAPWVLSTWFGDWLASQSPNPSWQHRVSLKHLQNTVILCHFVPLLGMLCHLGGWDNGCRHMISTTHKLHKPDKQHSVLLTNLVLGLLDRQVLRNLVLQATLFDWGCTILGGVCQLDCWKNCQRKAWGIWTSKLPN